jgi:hypothetical protein
VLASPTLLPLCSHSQLSQAALSEARISASELYEKRLSFNYLAFLRFQKVFLFYFYVIFILSEVILYSYFWYLISSWNQISLKWMQMLVMILSAQNNHYHPDCIARKPTYESN